MENDHGAREKRTLMAKTKRSKVTRPPYRRATSEADFRALSPEGQRKVERALRPRDKVLSLRFFDGDITRWRAAAEAEHQNMTDVVERVMNAWADKVLIE
jgi:hypothetical protein